MWCYLKKMQLTKLCASLMRLLSGDREAILTAFENVMKSKWMLYNFSKSWQLFTRSRVKKNVERSNDEIDKIIEATDKEISSVKDFLSSSRKPSSQVPDKHVGRTKILEQHRSLFHNRINHQVRLTTGNSKELNCRHFLALVVERLDNAIHRINRYPADKCWKNKPRYSLDSDLFGFGR